MPAPGDQEKVSCLGHSANGLVVDEILYNQVDSFRAADLIMRIALFCQLKDYVRPGACAVDGKFPFESVRSVVYKIPHYDAGNFIPFSDEKIFHPGIVGNLGSIMNGRF
jgi:hypothetical protein